jgi:hypothetical protein
MVEHIDTPHLLAGDSSDAPLYLGAVGSPPLPPLNLEDVFDDGAIDHPGTEDL